MNIREIILNIPHPNLLPEGANEDSIFKKRRHRGWSERFILNLLEVDSSLCAVDKKIKNFYFFRIRY